MNPEAEMLAYMERQRARAEKAYWRGFRMGLRTNWRWRLYFWLERKLR